MAIQTLAVYLLLGRLLSDFFIILVLRKQWKHRKTKTHPRLMAIRRVLAALAILVFLGNLYPLGLDIFTIFYPEFRTTQDVNLLGVLYTLDVNLTFLFASILIYVLYRLADTVIEIADLVGVEAVKPVPIDKKVL